MNKTRKTASFLSLKHSEITPKGGDGGDDFYISQKINP